MWAWQTICGVAFAGSVQHLVERSVPLVSSGWSTFAGNFDAGGAAAASDTAAAAAGTGACAIEAMGGALSGAAAAGRAGMCLASLSTAHLARHQPVLSMSIAAA